MWKHGWQKLWIYYSCGAIVCPKDCIEEICKRVNYIEKFTDISNIPGLRSPFTEKFFNVVDDTLCNYCCMNMWLFILSSSKMLQFEVHNLGHEAHPHDLIVHHHL